MSGATSEREGTPAAPGQTLLSRMLERLYASMRTGPAMSCRPHSSRQRVDLAELARLDGVAPHVLLAELLGPEASTKRVASASEPDEGATDEARRAYEHREAVLRKLRTIAEDAATFEQEHGVHALYVGFPLLSVEPRARGQGQRVLAPIALVPVTLTLKRGRRPSVELACAADGRERLIPNPTLLAWLEQQSGSRIDELFEDEEGNDPWREVGELVGAVFRALELEPPEAPWEGTPVLPVPRSDEPAPPEPRLLASAVLGLYPMSNQALVRDTQALLDGEPTEGPIRAFLDVGAALVEDVARAAAPAAVVSGRRAFGEERLVTLADPCQARAVRLARTTRGLVVHGPPGTGKSQTITNILGDHLARGERVLLVCDKRTALDVVQHRLLHLGLADLCAVVHDAQRDQRDLYMGIRTQLDGLAEAKPDPRALATLEAIDEELTRIHEELSAHHELLATRPDEGRGESFHELVGEWLATDAPPALVAAVGELPAAAAVEAAAHARVVDEVLARARKIDYARHPFRDALGIALADWLAQPVERWRAAVAELVARGARCDARAAPAPPFDPAHDVVAQGHARAALAATLERALDGLDEAVVAHWASASDRARAKAAAELDAIAPAIERLSRAAPDPELAVVARAQRVELGVVAEWLAVLGSYLATARKWYAFLFFFTRRRRAAAVLERLGLPPGADAAERAEGFLAPLRAKSIVSAWHEDAFGDSSEQDALLARARGSRALLAALGAPDDEPALASVTGWIATALATGRRAEVLAGLSGSAERARAIADLDEALVAAGLFRAPWLDAVGADVRGGADVAPRLAALADRLDEVEDVLRIGGALAELPQALAAATEALAVAGAEPREGAAALQKAALAARIRARLRTDGALAALDGARLEAYHRRYRELERDKQAIVVRAVRHVWTSRQRERLLAATGTRLNAAGAAIRRRLVLRGERAMKVRQAIAAGADAEGGDPLFDLRPVWMASPSTVAQIFPRAPIFDVVVFDEASQCRLEEALPVLLRARRVVIAGDPKQLPPTRFFESSVVESSAEEADGDQALFEEQQAEIDDLLGAALNLEIEQAYLDVHYRSRNADLIGFSNESFYDARLQAIPGHPSHRAKHAPLRLVQVHGTYAERQNAREAEKVVEIVTELLARAEAPSIGVVSFNLAQRDRIVEELERAALASPRFAERLDAARRRRGADSFEGLFVRNLESVQGDERDHIVISTTYGPDARGRFYRRFGPLGTAGGGRRLNVLVTRARHEIHLVTSIPPEAYRNVAPLEPGRQPNGAFHLFAYLRYAEGLERLYAEEAARLAGAEVAEAGAYVRETRLPSRVVEVLAARLAEGHRVASDVYWGNDGFSVDVALHHPSRAHDVTLGLLCDRARFDKTDDPVEWDVFRAAVLEAQGWDLLRLWTPELFRDPARVERAILEASARHVAAEAPEEVRAVDDVDDRTLH
ncbi:MAG: DUF4011 domain-containing protein [Sandaracinaceae bacterium]|nr:DUF4011 domain-containing protein [Sandaracinaceae bacterium]